MKRVKFGQEEPVDKIWQILFFFLSQNLSVELRPLCAV